MKKLLLSFVYFLLLAPFFLYSQEIYIPAKVDDAFKKTYPSISDYLWQSNGENFAVTFKVSNGQSLHVVYDTAGQVKEKYMALSSIFVMSEIANYVKRNFATASVKNYWVKQKGPERFYKVELSDNETIEGTITGSSYGLTSGTASSDSTLTSVQFSSSGNSYVYFDRFGNPISPKDAMSGHYVAKPKEQPKPKPVYHASNYKKGKAGKKKR